MREDVTLKRGEYGLRAVITDSWTEELSRYLMVREISELDLNYAKGWLGPDVEFLRGFSRIRALSILDWELEDLEPIHSLRELRRLEVSAAPRSKINFLAFPNLKKCGIHWRPGYVSIFDCTTLQQLVIASYKGREIEPIARLVNLEELQILSAPLASLKGIGALRNLRFLRVGRLTKLTSLDGMEELRNLRHLVIQTCNAYKSVAPLAHLPELRVAYIQYGRIDSLKPLFQLPKLRAIAGGGYVDDGDLSLFATFPSYLDAKNDPAIIAELIEGEAIGWWANDIVPHAS